MRVNDLCKITTRPCLLEQIDFRTVRILGDWPINIFIWRSCHENADSVFVGIQCLKKTQHCLAIRPSINSTPSRMHIDDTGCIRSLFEISLTKSFSPHEVAASSLLSSSFAIFDAVKSLLRSSRPTCYRYPRFGPGYRPTHFGMM